MNTCILTSRIMPLILFTLNIVLARCIPRLPLGTLIISKRRWWRIRWITEIGKRFKICISKGNLLTVNFQGTPLLWWRCRSVGSSARRQAWVLQPRILNPRLLSLIHKCSEVVLLQHQLRLKRGCGHVIISCLCHCGRRSCCWEGIGLMEWGFRYKKWCPSWLAIVHWLLLTICITKWKVVSSDHLLTLWLLLYLRIFCMLCFLIV